MHTLLVLAVGAALLAAMLFAGHRFGGARGRARAGFAFVPVWFGGAALNLWIGVAQAGYSFREEVPVFLLVFTAPALAAWLVRRQARSHR